jgi:hypothetical protein
VLTLSTEHADDALQLLAGYVHEQLHWYEEAYAEARDRAIEATRGPYPVVPVERPEGCGDEESTRLHLLVCCLELRRSSSSSASRRRSRRSGSSACTTTAGSTTEC